MPIKVFRSFCITCRPIWNGGFFSTKYLRKKIFNIISNIWFFWFETVGLGPHGHYLLSRVAVLLEVKLFGSETTSEFKGEWISILLVTSAG